MLSRRQPSNNERINVLNACLCNESTRRDKICARAKPLFVVNNFFFNFLHSNFKYIFKVQMLYTPYNIRNGRADKTKQ